MPKRKLFLGSLSLLLVALCAIQLAHREADAPDPSAPMPARQASLGLSQARQPITLELMAILEQQPELKGLLEQSLALARERNPDPKTNPAQSLEAYYAFLDRCVQTMPWEGLEAEEASLFDRIDQSLTYFYFLLDQPLPELENRGYLNPSLQYVEALGPWIVKYVQAWGSFLSTPQSWNSEYLELVRREERFGLSKGWYESPDQWRSWNDFFTRRLRSPGERPIAGPRDNALVCSPADAVPQGLWAIDEASAIVPGVLLKSTEFQSIPRLLGEDSAYARAFGGGSLTHTFLNVHDYHRVHFPLSGVVREAALLPAQAAVGGTVFWDPAQQRYLLLSQEPGWQSIETRARVILETEDFGLVALVPIGMSQVSSVVLEETVKPGARVQKGDPLGCFYFGGSDFVMIFQRGVKVELLMAREGEIYAHVLMGEPYAKLTRTLPRP